MIQPSAKLRLLGCSLLLSAGIAGAAFAEDFQSQQPPLTDPFDPAWSWNLPVSWKKASNQPGVPTTAADVGIVSKGRHIGIQDPLGADGNRPTIRVESGGLISLRNDMVSPLILDGGGANGEWMGKTVVAPTTVLSDSTFFARDDDGVQLHVAGPVSNPKPVTLHLDGGLEWASNSSKTFTGNISIDRGQVFVTGPLGTGQFGTGKIFLAAQTRLVVWPPVNPQIYQLSNDISGAGSIQVGDSNRICTLSNNGVTMHPGPLDKPGTMVVEGSLNFQRNAAGQPAKLLIDVRGDGTGVDDYGQLAIVGSLLDSLNNADLIVRLAPNITPDQAAKLRLIVLSASNPDDMTKPTFHPFHSVAVQLGDKPATASINIRHDPLSDLGIVEVSGITLK